MQKVIAWLKRYWIWILLPVGITLLILRFRKHTITLEDDDAALETATQMAEDARVHQEALDRLEQRYLEKLSQMTDGQRDEWAKLRQGSVEEAAAWIDKL